MTAGSGGLRAMTREAVRGRIAAIAVELYDEKGFDSVTVEQVSAAAGISPRSFHRYFAAKEDTVVGDASTWFVIVRDELEREIADESPWRALERACTALLTASGEYTAENKRGMRVLLSTPALRARNTEKHVTWARDLEPLVEDRLTGRHREIRARALLSAAFACLDAALADWAQSDAPSPLEGLRAAFAELARAPSAAHH